MRVPVRVQRCTTHHAACECREWQHEQVEMALRIIQTWASCDHLSQQTRHHAMSDIVQKCKEALAVSQAVASGVDVGKQETIVVTNDAEQPGSEQTLVDRLVICPGCGWVGHLGELREGACPRCEYENGVDPWRLLTVDELLQHDEATFCDVNLGAFLRSFMRCR